MKHFPLILVLFLFLLPAAHTQRALADQALATAMAENNWAGVVAGYAKDGQVAWEASAGYQDLKNEKFMGTTTLLRSASIAKSMTAIAIMQLQEQGLIDLQQPIQTYLPDFPKKKEGDITTWQLLTHTSGIKGYASGKEAETRKTYASLSDAVTLFQDRELAATPGKAFNYTTYGYVVLGLIIEKVSGMTYEAYMQKNIWDKAGMTSTGIDVYGMPKSNQSKLYKRKRNGKIKWAKNGSNLSGRIPGGGIYTTVGDLLRFGMAVLDNDFISAKSKEMMWEDPEIRAKDAGNGYGFGWFLYGVNPARGLVYGHSGGQTGCSAQFMILPEANAVVAVLANTSNDTGSAFKLSVKLFNALGEL